MKRNDWILIISIIFLFTTLGSVSTIYLIDKNNIPKFKTISMMEVMNDSNDEIFKQFSDGSISKDEYMKHLESKMQKIQEAINVYSNSKDVIFIEEAVIKSDKQNFISITDEIKDYVSKN